MLNGLRVLRNLPISEESDRLDFKVEAKGKNETLDTPDPVGDLRLLLEVVGKAIQIMLLILEVPLNWKSRSRTLQVAFHVEFEGLASRVHV
jgi:hypothetical protein